MVELTFLGGAREVGKEAILVDTGKERFLLDYGLNVQTMEVPIEPKLPLDAVLLSHTHVDHSGHIPYLYKRGYNKATWLTPPTLELCSMLLRDSIKVQKKRGLKPSFLESHIVKMENLARTVGYRKKIKFKETAVEFRDAGHIPGASSILLETGDKRILYTGDIKFIDTDLVKGADTDYKDIDVVISESTYSYKNHPDRKALAERLKENIQRTVYNNGVVLLPSFAVGRTQEMLIILGELGLPIYLDGMGIEATERILLHPNWVAKPKKLKKAFSRAHKVKKRTERAEIVNKPCIIISTAGMCLHPDTYIQQADGSCLKINDVHSDSYSLVDGHLKQSNVAVKLVKKSPKELIRLKTNVTTITSTKEHKFLTLDGLDNCWMKAGKLHKGDYIAYASQIPFKGKKQKINIKLSNHPLSKKINIPKETNPLFCQFLGYLLGDGDVKQNKIVRFTDKDIRNLKYYKQLGKRIFNIDGKIVKEGTRKRLLFYSSILAKFLKEIGIPKSSERKIPLFIQKTEKNDLGAFLRGLFDAEGSVVIGTNKSINFSSASYDLIQVTQLLLLRFGIYSELREVKKKVNGKYYKLYQLRICNPNSICSFGKNIGFGSATKNKKFSSLLKNIGGGWSHLDLLPVKKSTLYTEIKKNLKTSKLPQSFGRDFELYSTCSKFISRQLMRKLILKLKKLQKDVANDLIKRLEGIVNNNIIWVKILNKKIIKSDRENVFDLTVPGPSNYIANGFVVHNCQGGPITFYIKKLYKRGECSLILNGFMVHGTPGRTLLDTGRYVNEGLNVKPKMKVDFLDFSAHCGRDNLIAFLEKINPKKVFLVHGDRTQEFAQEMKEKGFDAHAPKNGERVRI